MKKLHPYWLPKLRLLIHKKSKLDLILSPSRPVHLLNNAVAKPMIGGVIETEAIWNCTTCFACQEVCPVWAEPMLKIGEMRRNLVLEQASIPETAEGALRSIEDRGHPWRGTLLD